MTIDYPGADWTNIYGVIRTGPLLRQFEVVGTYGDITGMHGFLMSGGVYTSLNVPAGGQTEALAINRLGQVVGTYEVPNGDDRCGFMYWKGTYTSLRYATCPSFDDADPTGYVPYGINDAGNIVGTYDDHYDDTLNSARIEGFYGTSTNIESTGYEFVGDLQSGLYGVNNASPNQMVGYSITGRELAHAVEWSAAGGPPTQIPIPAGAFATGVARGINDTGQVVGTYDVGGYEIGGYGPGIYGSHGFVYDHGTFRRLDYPGANRTVANGVSGTDMFETDGYFVVGTYESPGFDPETATGKQHGYLATIYPDDQQLP
jgi:uncharacterized membrane protein